MKQLLKTVAEKYSCSGYIFIWFTDKNIFAMATPKKNKCSECGHGAIKKKDVATKHICTQIMFSHLLMMSVGETKFGYTSLIFVIPRVKVNGIL